MGELNDAIGLDSIPKQAHEKDRIDHGSPQMKIARNRAMCDCAHKGRVLYLTRTNIKKLLTLRPCFVETDKVLKQGLIK